MTERPEKQLRILGTFGAETCALAQGYTMTEARREIAKLFAPCRMMVKADDDMGRVDIP